MTDSLVIRFVKTMWRSNNDPLPRVSIRPRKNPRLLAEPINSRFVGNLETIWRLAALTWLTITYSGSGTAVPSATNSPDVLS